MHKKDEASSSPPSASPSPASAQQAKKIEKMRIRLRQRYPVAEFNALRKTLDPHSILSNSLVDELIGDTCSTP